MNDLIPISVIYIFVVMLCSCNKSIITKNHIDYLSELNKYQIELTKQNDNDNLSFVAQYIPKEKYALQSSIIKENVLDTLAYQTKVEDINSKLVFSLKLSDLGHGILGDAKNPDQIYYAKLEYFINPARYDIQLLHGDDTLLCKDYHFERYYDYAPYSTVLVTFDLKDKYLSDDMILQFNYPFSDQSEDLRDFVFKYSDLNSLPQLNI